LSFGQSQLGSGQGQLMDVSPVVQLDQQFALIDVLPFLDVDALDPPSQFEPEMDLRSGSFDPARSVNVGRLAPTRRVLY
jgi:hypothetical protein